jgi:hypothetical protein
MFVWGLIIATAAAAAVSLLAVGLSVDWGSVWLPGALCLLVLVALWFYTAVRPDRRIAACLRAVLQLIAFTAPAMALSYAMVAMNHPLWDDTLLGWDKAIGFDWFAYARFVVARPWLEPVLRFAYLSLIPQMFLACTVLGLAGEFKRVHIYVAAFIVSGLVAILFSAVMPCLSMFAHLAIPAGSYPVFAVHLLTLRDGTMSVISLANADGLITFPSYHTALAVIYTAAFWPIRGLKWVALIVNVLLIAATPVHGWHYIVDVIAGIVLGAAAWWVAAAASRPEQLALRPGMRRL